MHEFLRFWYGEIIFFSFIVVFFVCLGFMIAHDMNVEAERSVSPILLFEAHGCKVYEYKHRNKYRFFHHCEKE